MEQEVAQYSPVPSPYFHQGAEEGVGKEGGQAKGGRGEGQCQRCKESAYESKFVCIVMSYLMKLLFY
eukprot:5567257-Ditylum_brightwellii.AAC.1